MKIGITIECSTEDEALDVVQRIVGVAGVNVTTNVATPKPAADKAKSATPKQKAEAAAVAEASPPAKPAAAGKKAKAAVPTQEQIKLKIAEMVGEENLADPDVKAQIKEFVAQFGVKQLSDLTDEQRQAAFDEVEDFFASSAEDAEDEDDDPMA